MHDYQQLFEDYVAEMRGAQAVAVAWWDGLLAREMAPGIDAAQADERVSERWPMGAVSHPFVIATFRKWALRCQALNDAADSAAEADDEPQDDDDPDDGWGDEEDDDADLDLADLEAPVEPRELLVEMLPGRADDLAQFLADFVFVPLGLDRDDRWI